MGQSLGDPISNAGADWRAALPAADLGEHEMRGVDLGGHHVLLLRSDGELRAWRDACPHEGYALSRHGERQDFVIVCQKHLWEFDAASGEHISRIPRPQCNLRGYPVREVGGTIEVDVSAHPLPMPVEGVRVVID